MQVLHLLPVPGLADFRTPLRGLYNASCASPGAGLGDARAAEPAYSNDRATTSFTD